MDILRLAEIEKDLQKKNKRQLKKIEENIDDLVKKEVDAIRQLDRLYTSIAHELALIINNASKNKGINIVSDIRRVVKALENTMEHPYLDDPEKRSIEQLISRLNNILDKYSGGRKVLFGKKEKGKEIIDHRQELSWLAKTLQSAYKNTIERERKKITDEELKLSHVLKQLAG